MHFFSAFTLVTVLHVLIIVGVSYQFIQVRLPVATSLAWLILVFFLPLLDAAEPILRAVISDIDRANRFCTTPGWFITPVAPISVICGPPAFEFMDLGRAAAHQKRCGGPASCLIRLGQSR